MSYTVPYSFVPGTKARAQEVNANFAAILDSVEEIDANKINLDLSNISSEGIDVIKNNSSIRNIGELVFSPISITDSGLHLLDGAIIQRNGIYKDFVDFIADKYNSNMGFNRDIFAVTGSPSITFDGILTNITTGNYVRHNINGLPSSWKISLKGTSPSTLPASSQNTLLMVKDSIDNNILLTVRIGENQSALAVWYRNSGGTYTNTSINITADTEYTVIVEASGSNLTVKINGDSVINTNTLNTSTNIQYIEFGSTVGGNNPWTGLINLKSAEITKDGVTLSGSSHSNCFTDETTWQNTVGLYGECGKFVYDSNANTVRLPKISGLIEYTSSLGETGNLTEAGLPNITGEYKDNTGRIGNYNSHSGALSYKTANTNNFGDGANSSNHVTEINFDASRSSSIYGNSDTVQPQTIKYLVYIVTATTPKTDIQVNIDNIATDINRKLDSDFSNISANNIRNFDGQWVYKHSVINNNANLSTGKYDVNLSSYLPEDQNKYEVIVNIYGAQNSSSSSSFVILSSGLIAEPGTTLSYSNFAVNSNSTVQGMQTTVPVGLNKVLSYRIGGTNFDSLYIRLYGYRRIGTNN